ncbi:MAG: hypothetical protein BIFFINMI_00848 [Phycisphaerae bacterium]|nr:hypothetical protein [Phycisphaerae bacterium]
MGKESHFLKHEGDRAEEFRPNQKLVERIAQLKALLGPVQAAENSRFSTPRLPVAVIVGCPRSGTTVLTQILAASGDFAYPTNMLSRFAYAPMVGAMFQQLLFDPQYDYRNELADIQSSSGFKSTLGKTTGAMAISEFFHFWRRFFPNHDPGHMTPEELAQVDIPRMRAELASIESVFGKPFMSKGMMMQYNIPFFAQRMPELLFIHIRRQPRFLLQSVMQSRKKYYGTDQIWWSVKPKEYDLLASMDPVRQVAGQVYFTVKSIDEDLEHVPDSQKLVYAYEDLCADPGAFYGRLSEIMARRGCPLRPYALEERFNSANDIKMPQTELQALESAYEAFATGQLAGGR